MSSCGVLQSARFPSSGPPGAAERSVVHSAQQLRRAVLAAAASGSSPGVSFPWIEYRWPRPHAVVSKVLRYYSYMNRAPEFILKKHVLVHVLVQLYRSYE